MSGLIQASVIPVQEKCWGTVQHIEDPEVLVSVLHVNQGWKCSLHRHKHRFNQFHIISGRVRVRTYDMEEKPNFDRTVVTSWVLGEGKIIVIDPRMWHRFEVLDSGIIVETYWTTDFTKVDINDIDRFDEGGKI